LKCNTTSFTDDFKRSKKELSIPCRLCKLKWPLDKLDRTRNSEEIEAILEVH
jgi:hypothetical protein